MPQRTASKRDSGIRSAAALFATCRVRCATESVAARNRSICSRAKSGSVSAVARCVITPTTARVGAGSSETPQRPMPVSSFTCTTTPSGISVARDDELEPASRASATSSFDAGPSTSSRAAGNSPRSASASPTVATHRARAPASSAAAAQSSAPWP